MSTSIGILGYYYFAYRLDLSAATSDHHFNSIIPIICVSVYMSCFSLGIGPVVWVLITEVTPPQTIGLVSSIASMFTWIWSFVVVNEVTPLMELLTTAGTYWLFSSICALCILFAYLLPETKGKSREEIAVIFKY